jgi:hypothetical protein
LNSSRRPAKLVLAIRLMSARKTQPKVVVFGRVEFRILRAGGRRRRDRNHSHRRSGRQPETGLADSIGFPGKSRRSASLRTTGPHGRVLSTFKVFAENPVYRLD